MTLWSELGRLALPVIQSTRIRMIVVAAIFPSAILKSVSGGRNSRAIKSRIRRFSSLPFHKLEIKLFSILFSTWFFP